MRMDEQVTMKHAWWLIGGSKKWSIPWTHLRRCNKGFRIQPLHAAIYLNPSLRPHSNRNMVHRRRDPGSSCKAEQVTKKEEQEEEWKFLKEYGPHSPRGRAASPHGWMQWVSWWPTRPHGMMPPWVHGLIEHARLASNLGGWGGRFPWTGGQLDRPRGSHGGYGGKPGRARKGSLPRAWRVSTSVGAGTAGPSATRLSTSKS